MADHDIRNADPKRLAALMDFALDDDCEDPCQGDPPPDQIDRLPVPGRSVAADPPHDAGGRPA